MNWYTYSIAALVVAGIWLLYPRDTEAPDREAREVREIGHPGGEARTGGGEADEGSPWMRSRPTLLAHSRGAAADEVFTEARFEAAKERAYHQWYMRARQALEGCTQLSERFGEMRDVRIMLAYDPDAAGPGMHPYIVDHLEFVEQPDAEPMDERQTECLDRLRGDRLEVMASFTEIPATHHHLMTMDSMPVP